MKKKQSKEIKAWAVLLPRNKVLAVMFPFYCDGKITSIKDYSFAVFESKVGANRFIKELSDIKGEKEVRPCKIIIEEKGRKLKVK